MVSTEEISEKSKELGTIPFFKDAFSFLSNMYSEGGPLFYGGKEYRTSEHAYQAYKMTSEADHEVLRRLHSPPYEAKTMARTMACRSDWDDVKVGIMLDVLRLKFYYPAMRDLLLATGDAELVEGNTWHDTFWGVCRGSGQNILGKLLMKVRGEMVHQGYPSTSRFSHKIFELFPINDLGTNALGLCGEAGEFANKVKKRMYEEVPREALLEELADTLWHVSQCSTLLGSSLDELMAISLDKTIKRNAGKSAG